ncbi:hypothetical protein [Streptomyces sp. NRRL F-5123]|uniref:hypothetical protein n=1 Tax=Streptomyces sp. NRRL F-5123 TaxID=1463856 RepID=UPI0004E0DEBF|nr:hypothetical protein [Streptomyces sp. NRRL F-5123]
MSQRFPVQPGATPSSPSTVATSAYYAAFRGHLQAKRDLLADRLPVADFEVCLNEDAHGSKGQLRAARTLIDVRMPK